MKISELCIQRPVLTWMLSLSLVVFGALGYSRLGVEQYPDMEFPQVVVTALLDGANPEGIEQDVTDVLEEHLNSISGIHSMRSTSFQGASRITVEFELGTDLDRAIQDVRDQVAKARRFLPNDVEPPQVERMQTGAFPVIYVPFRSDTRPAVEVSEFVRRQVKPVLETIPGVGAVQISGRRDRNIRIWLDADALRARGLAANDIIDALRREHVDIPGGVVEGQRIEWSVKTMGEFESLDAMREMTVARRGEAPVYLKDVARLEDGTEDNRSLVRYNGSPAVVAGVIKQTDGNTVAVVDEVRRRVEALRPLLPDGIETVPGDQFVDFSYSVRESIDETMFSLYFGGILAVLSVLVFLRRMQPTLIIAAAIPLSLIATFGLVWAWGYTLNVMTLLGMTLAIGVVVDDAIIVLENIERHRDMGKDGFEAAIEGTREVSFAAVVATLSIAMVFLPVFFAEGIVGNFLGELGLTVAGSVMLSLLVALTLTPMLAARIPAPAEHQHGSLWNRLERWFTGMERSYARVLDWTLHHRIATVGIALASFVLAIFFGSQLGAEFFPTTDGRIVFMQFETAPGTSLEATEEMLLRNERYFLALPERQAVFEGIGGNTSTSIGRTNAGAVFATLTPSQERERGSMEIIKEARGLLSKIPGQRFNIGDPAGQFSTEGKFQLELLGNVSVADLDRYATAILSELRQIKGFVDLDKNLKIGSPEVRIIPDREKAAELGVDAATLSRVVQLTIGGANVGVFKENGLRYDIRMRLERGDRDTPDAISGLSVRSRDGKVVDLRNLVEVETGAAPSTISRTDRQRSVKISGNLDGLPLGEAVEKAMAVAKRVVPPEVHPKLAGQAETMRQSAEQFFAMLVLSVLVIYMLLAAQFESFVLPLSVMLALPFAMIGALGGLYVAGMTINMFSMIGIILLMGLVGKNSILLVDFANQLRGQGMSAEDAMAHAAPIRLRPVLMTAISMIFGVLPAMFGLGPGAENRQPLAVAAGAGMFSSMLLTLLVVPVFYIGLEHASDWVRTRVARRRDKAAGVVA